MKVSIPVGFSDALRLGAIFVACLILLRFQSLLGFLMRCDSRCIITIMFATSLFQSLLGFLMRCDAMVGSPYQPNIPPKSPEIRDSNHEPPPYHALIKVHDRLNLSPPGGSYHIRRPLRRRLPEIVSIPVGFSDALRQALLAEPDLPESRFDPCWVFRRTHIFRSLVYQP